MGRAWAWMSYGVFHANGDPRPDRSPMRRRRAPPLEGEDLSGDLPAWPEIEPASHYQPIADADLAQGVKRKGR